MIVTIKKSHLKGTVDIIASKSLSHRYLIAASLANETSTLKNLMQSADIIATKEALIALGAEINQDDITGPIPHHPATPINAKASGSTLRFLIPIALLSSHKVQFIGEARLPKRPLDVYKDLFTAKNIYYNQLTDDYLPLEVKGPLKPGRYKIPGNQSSQFISGLLFALPLLEEDSIIEIIPPFESEPYVNLTIKTLNDFNIHIIKQGLTFKIPKNSHYQAVNKTIEGDFSQAAFFIVAGLLNDEPLKINGLNKDSYQGDKAILDIVKTMHGHYKWDQDTLIVYPSQTKATTIDLKQIPDLGPILMILAALSEGATTFTNIHRLRLKESDRIAAMHQTLKHLNVSHDVYKNHMIIHGQTILSADHIFDSFHDHRIVMSILIASLKTKGNITIKHAEAINKSYPNFIETLKQLGANITIRSENNE